MPRDLIIFKKFPCRNVFRLHENETSAINKFLRAEERFRKKKRAGSHFHQLASLEDSTLAASLLLVVQCVRAELLLSIYIAVGQMVQ